MSSVQKSYVRLRRVLERVGKIGQQLTGRRKTLYVWDRVPFYRDLWRSAAQRNGLEIGTLSDEVWELRKDGRCLTRINNCYVELDDPVTLYIAGDKGLTFKLLEDASLPVAAHAEFTLAALEPLRQFVAENKGPYVVKPASGTGSGLGVSTHLYTLSQCLNAAALASLYDRRILIERFIPGEVFRLLFVGGDFVTAVRRRGVRVVGDGESTLEALVRREFGRRDELGPYKGWDKDLDLAATTLTQGLERSTVPAKGREILVKSVAHGYSDNREIRTIYTEDATDDVCQALIDDARTACRALRSDFCGVDVITTDPARSLRETGGVVGEINTTPGLHHHYLLTGPVHGDRVVDVVVELVLARRKYHDARR